MALISVEHIAKSEGARTLFSDVSFQIDAGGRLGLVGPNGAGKTTLLNLIAGFDVPDAGTIVRARDLTIGYLRQDAIEMEARPLWDGVMAAQEELLRLEREIRSLEARIADDPDEATLRAYSRATEAFEAAGGYDLEVNARTVLAGLGFSEDDLADLSEVEFE